MTNDFTTSLLKRISSCSSFDRKIEYHSNMINGVIKNFNDISFDELGLLCRFKFKLNDFQKKPNSSKGKYTYTIEFYYNGHISEFVYIDVDIFNENNYDVIFNKMFDVLLNYSDISDLITAVNLNKSDGNIFTNYLKKNLKYLPDNVEFVDEQSY